MSSGEESGKGKGASVGPIETTWWLWRIRGAGFLGRGNHCDLRQQKLTADRKAGWHWVVFAQNGRV